MSKNPTPATYAATPAVAVASLTSPTRQVEACDDGSAQAPAAIPPKPVLWKGRGATAAPQHRFARDVREWADDGWAPVQPDAAGLDNGRSSERVDAGDAVDGVNDEAIDDASWWATPPQTLATQVHEERARSAIQSNDSPDIFFEKSVNPYRGCEHGCIYCYARPYHSYLNLSPGLDFETQLFAKTNIAEVLRREIGHPRYQPASLNIGSATDCYQPIERDWQLTRQVLEVLCEARHPFSLITKSSAVERDIDLIAAAARQQGAAVYITITSLDAKLTRLLEPRAAAPHRRLRTIRRLADAGIPVGVSVAPHIPLLNDDMEQVLAAARDAGASSAFYTVLRLPWELNGVFQQWLHAHYPERAARVMARVRDLHQISEADRALGKSYNSQSFTRMKGQGLWADLVRQRFTRACAQLGLVRERVTLDWAPFAQWQAQQQKPPPPLQAQQGRAQMPLF